MDKDLKRVEHRKKCRLCRKTAQLKKGKRTYCALCFHIAFQMEKKDQSPVELTSGDLVAALNKGLITGRAAAELLDRVLKERVV